ncbi:MAG: PorT family protein [candidate division Zixibacteria bacterium]|nr:PorT family protein [candidate division Zixibacteria bacterium]
MRICRAVIITIACTVLFVSCGFAGEKASYGLKIGYNSADIKGDFEQYVGSSSSRSCMTFGGFAMMHQFGIFYLQPEFLYIEKGATSTESNKTLKLAYLEIPFLIKCKFNRNKKLGLSVYYGPAADLLLSSEYGTLDLKSNTAKIDGCLIVGGSIDIQAGSGYLFLESRYSYGLTSINDSEIDLDVRNRVFTIMLGYSFNR